jgi:outer membrane scaffolding protein for murein synthesis (MipA/OmpV family)
MINDKKDVKFTSLEQFQEYYRVKKGESDNKEHNRYYTIGLEAAKLASESTLKMLDLRNKSID